MTNLTGGHEQEWPILMRELERERERERNEDDISDGNMNQA